MNKQRFFNVLIAPMLLISSQLHANNYVPFKVYTENHPPVQFEKGGQVVGPAAEIVNEMLAEAGIEAGISAVPWARGYNAALNKTNVLIFSMLRTPARENKFHWIGVVSQLRPGFLGLSNRTDIQINHLDDARKWVLAVIRDAYSHSHLVRNKFSEEKNIFLVATLQQQLRLLSEGKVDLLLTDPVSVRYRYQQQGLDPSEIKVHHWVPELRKEMYVAASLKTSAQWVDKLRKAMAKVQKKATYSERINRFHN